MPIRDIVSALTKRKQLSDKELRDVLRCAIGPEYEDLWELSWTEAWSPKGRVDNYFGWCCVPLGLAGPLNIDGIAHVMPMATSEGALIASVCRGCKALNSCSTVLVSDQMSRGPVLRAESAIRSVEIRSWVENNFQDIKERFDSVSSHLSLLKTTANCVGPYLFVRFEASSGNAMGMNMVSAGSRAACDYLVKHFPTLVLVSLSGNYCVDKKPSHLNVLLGRGKGVIAEAFIPNGIIESILKCTLEGLLQTFFSKCYLGSSLSGTVGGNNAHAANVVAALFAATGQDLAQAVESSSCFTLLEMGEEDGIQGINASVSMPCLEVATVGGGTTIPGQNAALCLALGSCDIADNDSCQRFARNIAAFVLAGEISLLASLCEGSLVQAHQKLNK
jgi:hydroxymethylglutaryl-CoA reductase (NADPH)